MASQYYNMNEYFEDLYHKLFTKQNKKKEFDKRGVKTSNGLI